MVGRAFFNDRRCSTAVPKDYDLDEDVAEPGVHKPPGSQALPIEEEERTLASQPSHRLSEKPEPVSWKSLPRKDQLFILTMARLSEPLTQTSLQSYMFYQLRSFSPSAPDSTISYQTGMLQAAFTGA